METNEAEDNLNNAGVNLRQFEELIQASALKFAVNLASNMAIPRNYVFEVIGDFRKYIVAAITEGIKNVIVPILVKNTDKDQVVAFIQICNSAFCDIETEAILDSTLNKANLLKPIRKFPIGFHKEELEESLNISAIRGVNIVY